ncbi:MAG: di-trans,poly-cis-decaprenylcistransferase [Deltaproteobacteria bacterium]|nr:di-trans,poly-cis-decaprenylcistransferase [Deltaproteobacteria bacterium]
MNMNEQAKLPRHVAIIMDGNGRWARSRGLPRMLGHREGAKSVRRIVTACRERGIEVLSLFAFSSQNWSRPSPEVEALMALLAEYVDRERKTIMDNEIRLTAIGDIDQLPKRPREALSRLIGDSSSNTKMTLCLALSYGGREEIVEAARRIATKTVSGELTPGDVTADAFENELWSHSIGSVDLMIRTSGELRISNFLLWGLAYSELYFTDLMWPEFDERALDDALRSYATRQRRFGKIG